MADGTCSAPLHGTNRRMQMRYWKVVLLAPALMLAAAACNRDNDRAAADSALGRDLSLANQVAPYQLDSISAAEAGLAAGTGTAVARRSTAARTSSTARAPVRRRTTARAGSSGSSGTVTSSSGGTVSSSSGGEVVVKKNTKRDAIIGAAAGAAIGAATSKDKLKGAVIGGVVGGVLGGVIGNNVDVKKTRKP